MDNISSNREYEVLRADINERIKHHDEKRMRMFMLIKAAVILITLCYTGAYIENEYKRGRDTHGLWFLGMLLSSAIMLFGSVVNYLFHTTTHSKYRILADQARVKLEFKHDIPLMLQVSNDDKDEAHFVDAYEPLGSGVVTFKEQWRQYFELRRKNDAGFYEQEINGSDEVMTTTTTTTTKKINKHN